MVSIFIPPRHVAVRWPRCTCIPYRIIAQCNCCGMWTLYLFHPKIYSIFRHLAKIWKTSPEKIHTGKRLAINDAKLAVKLQRISRWIMQLNNHSPTKNMQNSFKFPFERAPLLLKQLKRNTSLRLIWCNVKTEQQLCRA